MDTSLDDRLRDLLRESEDRAARLTRNALHDPVESKAVRSQVAHARSDAEAAIEAAEAQLRERPAWPTSEP